MQILSLAGIQPCILAGAVSSRAGRYTGIKSKRRYFSHTAVNIQKKILHRQTDIRTVKIPVYTLTHMH